MQTVIYLGKEKLIGAKVDERKPSVVESHELGWDSNTLDMSLSKLTEKLNTRKFRLLLDDRFSYVLRMTIPAGLSENEERILISNNISEKIPEMLSELDWDYKEIKFSYSPSAAADGRKDKDVLVFSPVKYVMELLIKAVDSLGLTIEAMEPVEIAVTRNSNPLIGLSMKEDISGKDHEVLNIPLIKGKKEDDFKNVIQKEIPQNSAIGAGSVGIEKPNAEIPENGKKTGKPFLTFAYVIIILITLISLSALGYFIYRDFFKRGDDYVESPNVAPTSYPSPTQTPPGEEDLEEEEITLSGYNVMVKNGSGIKGEAQSAADLLIARGFERVETGNADSYEYTKTLVLIKEDIPGKLFGILAEILEDRYHVASESSLLTGSDYDIEVVVGGLK